VLLLIVRLFYAVTATIFLAGAIFEISANKDMEMSLFYIAYSMGTCFMALAMEEWLRTQKVKHLEKKRVTVDELYGRSDREEEIQKGKKSRFH
jgi:hypothetical protein